MKFKLKSANYIEYPELGLVSDEDGYFKDGVMIDISTMTELEKISSVCGESLIVDFSHGTIEIYDGYIE